MSLEQILKDNIKAVEENTEAVKANTASVQELIAVLKEGNALPIGPATEKVIETAKKSTPAPKTEAPVSSPSGAAPQSETAPAAVDQETKPIDFTEDIVKPFGKLCVAKGRDAGAAILAKWGTDKLSKIPADKHGELMADILKASE